MRTDPVSVNLMEFDTRLLDVSRGSEGHQGSSPCDLAQTHLIANKHAPNLVDILVQLDNKVDTRHLRLHPVGERDQLDRLVKFEWFARLSEFSRFHPVEREHIVENLSVRGGSIR